MELKETVKKLNSLVQLDIDAIHAYDQAISKIDVSSLREDLIKFKADHQRHVRELSGLVRKNGGEPPEYSADFKGFLIQGFTALRSITGTEGALKAMKTNETLTTHTYDSALSWDLPEEAKEVVRRNCEDEHRHLRHIEQCIESRVWERKGAA